MTTQTVRTVHPADRAPAIRDARRPDATGAAVLGFGRFRTSGAQSAAFRTPEPRPAAFRVPDPQLPAFGTSEPQPPAFRASEPWRRPAFRTPAPQTSALRTPEPRPPATGPITIRELGAGEAGVLLTVFDGLSAASRFRRFHGAVPTLAPRMVERLSDVDGHRHVAVAAFDGSGAPIGIARLIGIGAGRADLAVEVVDDWHGHGVGARLVRAVASLGLDRGYTQVVADVLVENSAVIALLSRVFPVQHRVRSGTEMSIVADLAGTPEPLPAAA